MGKNKNKAKKSSPQVQSSLDDLVDKLLYSCSTQLSSPKEEWSNILEIHQILDKINNIEINDNSTSNRYENLDSFLTWAKENGAVWEGVKVQKIDGKDLGIVANKEIKEDDLYLKIPRKLILSSENATAKLGNLVHKDVVLRAMPNVLLAFYLLIEACNSNSFWKPYISILPTSFSTVLYFTPKELEELQSSPTLAEAINLQRSIARQYAYLYKLFQSNAELKSLNARKCFTYNLYRWAVSCVMTRQNSIPRKSKRRNQSSEDGSTEGEAQDQSLLKSLALIPLWDLCNHQIGKFSTDFNTTKDELECFAMKDFKLNEEVTMFYGPRPNSELFIHSGFIIPSNMGNCYDTYSLKLGISNNDPLSNDKNVLCEKLGLPSKGTFVIRANEKPIDEILVNFCKISTMDKSKLEVMLAKTDDLSLSFSNDEVQNKKALEFLHMRLSILFRSYKTSIEDDETLLLGDNISDNVRLAIAVRLSEKILLKKVIALSSMST